MSDKDHENDTLLADALRRSFTYEPSRTSDSEDTPDTHVLITRGIKADPSSNNDVNSPTKLDGSPFRSNSIPEGYGFRPISGSSTPLHTVMQHSSTDGTQSPLPDPNGLGWPGMSALYDRSIFSQLA